MPGGTVWENYCCVGKENGVRKLLLCWGGGTGWGNYCCVGGDGMRELFIAWGGGDSTFLFNFRFCENCTRLM